MRTVLRRPDFRLFFYGVVATMVGESALLLVLAIWVKQLTGSSSLAGLTLFAIAAPALAAPVLGWVVDRFRRRPFLVVTLLGTTAVLVPLAFVRTRDDIWIIYAVAVLYGASMLVAGAATNGLIKDLLPEDLLAEANGALQTVRQGLRLVAPIGGAGLFTVVGGPAVVAVDVACLVLGATAIGALKLREAGPERSEMRWLAEVGAGLRHLFGPAALRRATIGLALTVAVIGFAETVFFSYVDEGLHRGPAFVSLIVVTQGVGGLTGGLVASRIVRAIGEVGSVGLGVFFFGAGVLGFVYPNLVLAFVFAAVIGFGIPIALVGFNTLMQRVTPAAVLGRVGAAAEAVISTPQALSIAGGAALATVIDYRVIFVLMAVVMIAAGAYLWRGRALSTAPAPAVAAPDAVATPDAA